MFEIKVYVLASALIKSTEQVTKVTQFTESRKISSLRPKLEISENNFVKEYKMIMSSW